MRWLVMFLLLSTTAYNKVFAQGNELAQLALNIEKLAQFKSILSDLKKGYDILSKGYGTVKDLTQGNFSIHRVFLDGLLEVSPVVRRYHKVPRIISYQLELVNDCKRAQRQFRASGHINPEKIVYLGRVYEKLIKSSLRNLDELATVLTSGKLRMSDDERLEAIDRLFAEMEERVFFLRDFNVKTGIYAAQRRNETGDIEGMKMIYGLKK